MSETRQKRWAHRGWRMLIVAALLFGVNGVFYAIGDDGNGRLGQTPPSMAWIQLEDDREINAWQHELAIKTDFWDPFKSFSAMATDLIWGGYRSFVMTGIWFLDWVISFEWLDILVSPLLSVGDALSSVIARLGLVPVFLAITGVVVALHWLRGRYASGVYDAVAAGIVVALAAGFLSNPVHMIAGEGGWIYQTRDYTLDLVAAMDDNASADQNAITSSLVRTFVRQPAQIISFGKVLDGTECEAVYDEIVSQGPHGYGSDIRDALRGCDPEAYDYAENPNGGTVAAALTLMPSAFVVIAMAAVIGGVVMVSIVTVALAGIRALINLVFAVLPGGARRPLAQTAADVIIGLAVFVFTLFFLMVFLQVVQALFASEGSQPMRAFWITNVMLIVGLVVFLRYRKRLSAAAGRVTEFLSKRPGGPLPKPISTNGRTMATAAAAGYGAYRFLRSPARRRALTSAAMGAVGLATGNPALASRVIFSAASRGAAKRGKRPNASGRPGMPPAPVPPDPSPAPIDPAGAATPTTHSNASGTHRSTGSRRVGSSRPNPTRTRSAATPRNTRAKTNYPNTEQHPSHSSQPSPAETTATPPVTPPTVRQRLTAGLRNLTNRQPKPKSAPSLSSDSANARPTTSAHQPAAPNRATPANKEHTATKRRQRRASSAATEPKSPTPPTQTPAAPHKAAPANREHTTTERRQRRVNPAATEPKSLALANNKPPAIKRRQSRRAASSPTVSGVRPRGR